MRVNRTYPTIVGWSAELARKRVREENKAGSFGRGTVLPRISKPADIAAATSRQNDQPPVAALNIPSSSVDKVAGILQKLASTVGEFGEAMAEIEKQGAPVNVMRKTFSGLSNMLNVASTIEATATPTSSQLDDIFFGSESFTTKKKKQNFYERMTYEIERLQNLDINDADLIFFPVLRHGHYFLICINVKASKLEIIDNKSLVSGVTMKDKYGDCTTLLVTALKEYLALGSSALFWKVDELTEEVVDMSWKELENYIDCGLFVMRHMETYKGTLKKWNPGFKKKAKLNEEFLIGLRARSEEPNDMMLSSCEMKVELIECPSMLGSAYFTIYVRFEILLRDAGEASRSLCDDPFFIAAGLCSVERLLRLAFSSHLGFSVLLRSLAIVLPGPGCTKKQKKNATDQNLGIAQGQLLTCALILSRLASFGCKVRPSMFSLICCSPSRASELHSPGLPWAKALVSFSRSFLSKGNQTQSPEEEIKQELLSYSFFGIVLTEGSVSITYSPDALLPA
nr:uncharacterized protein LOC109158392 [Ipomoea batatas]